MTTFLLVFMQCQIKSASTHSVYFHYRPPLFQDKKKIQVSMKGGAYKKQNPEVCHATGTTGDYFANIRAFSIFANKKPIKNKMKYSDYEIAFSPARLSRYLNACGGDNNKALTLYRYNVKLCQKFYGVLSLFEVVLRNAINEYYKCHFGDNDWIRTQIRSGGMLENCPQLADMNKHITRLISEGRYTHDRLVSSLSFGFWTYLFNKQPFRKGGQTLLAILPNKVKGLGQRAVYNELMEIKKFRNRIAHHEPICFDTAGNKDVNFAQDNYNQILKYVCFLGYNKNELFYGLNVLPDKTITKINEL